MTASPSTRLKQIRSFKADDIPQVAELHAKVLRIADRVSPELMESYRAYFTEVFLSHPWPDESSPSLVHEEASGRITGFLAAMPRRLWFNGQTVRATITSQFVVDPDFRGMAGLRLLSAALAGPQDITIADESNADSRKIWEALGGSTSHLYSMRWLYPLRPCQFALFLAEKKRVLPALACAASQPAARSLDALAGRLLNLAPRQPASRVAGEDLDTETLLACLSEAGRKGTIRTLHDGRSLHWALQRAEQMTKHGRLQRVLLRAADDIAGWYLYYSKRGGMAEVIQIQATPGYAHDVIDHLSHQAWREGAIGLIGRMEPAMMQAFSDRHCLFHCGPQWMLLHSRRPELLHAFNQGTAGFSRLDGEWCLHFR